MQMIATAVNTVEDPDKSIHFYHEDPTPTTPSPGKKILTRKRLLST